MSIDVIHGLWVPEKTTNAVQSGGFYIWVEKDKRTTEKRKTVHPFHYQKDQLIHFLKTKLGNSGSGGVD